MSQSNESHGPEDPEEVLAALERDILRKEPADSSLREAIDNLNATEAPTLEVLSERPSKNRRLLRFAAFGVIAACAAVVVLDKAGVHLPSNEENARLTSNNPGAIVEVGKNDDTASTAQLGPSVRAMVLSGPEERTVKIMTALNVCGKELSAQSHYDGLRAETALTTRAAAEYTARADQEKRAADVLNKANVKCQAGVETSSGALVPVSDLGNVSIRRDFITDYRFMAWHDQREQYLTAQSWATSHQEFGVAHDNTNRVTAGDQVFGAPAQP